MNRASARRRGELSITGASTQKRKPESTPPLLKWAGGKRRLVPHLLQHLPSDVHDLIYYEPFVGAGSLFFAIQPNQLSFLSDANQQLIDCYSAIRQYPHAVYRKFVALMAADSRDHYYGIRDNYNRSQKSSAQAARFLYLNRTCYGGIFRVNRSGHFNVPYGVSKPPHIPSETDFLAAAQALSAADISSCGYEDALLSVGSGDFVYLDPPYPPLNGTSKFNDYTTDRFHEEDQRHLAATVLRLHLRGAKILMTNADTSLIRNLYEGFHYSTLSVTRWVTAWKKKHKVAELVISNYESGQLRLGEGF